MEAAPYLRGAHRAALVFLLTTPAFGCARARPTPATPPSPATRETAPPAQAAENPALKHFERAVADYRVQVARVATFVGSPQSEEIALRAAVDRLADAIEAIPYARSTELRAAAARIRSAPRAPLLAVMTERERMADARHALLAAADTLLEVADGPYAPDPRVSARAKAFRDSIERLGAAERLRARPSDFLGALRRADATLSAVREAAARGQFGPG